MNKQPLIRSGTVQQLGKSERIEMYASKVLGVIF